ncbi:MAG: phosphodiester glycosidase family protein [Ruminococcus sp.]|jgi:exopolysaccharide biosynthesis protein
MKKRLIAAVSDLLIAALLLCGIYGANYLMPQKGVMAQDMARITAPDSPGGQSALPVSQEHQEADSADTQKLQTLVDSNPSGLTTTKVKLDAQDWHKKFADKFTDQVISTDTSYTSPNLSVQLTYNSYNTNKLDHSQNGRHERYGSNISYVLADIYVGDITCLQTCFAENTYGVGYAEKLSDMSARLQSVLAVNGDSYSNSRHKDNGTIIRNGIIYRAQPTDMETCVLNWDGTMKIYGPEEMNTQQLIDSGAYQSWIFGPSLLDESGKAKTSFQTWPYITESHPRTAIGYYEPGHYCLLVVDGRQDNSRGMFLDEMANLFEQLGCKAAYNLDGGHCSFMTMQDQVANHPYKPEHTVEDGIFITEGLL